MDQKLPVSLAVACLALAACEPTDDTQTRGTYASPPPVSFPSATPSMPPGWPGVEFTRWQKAIVRPEKQHYVEAIGWRIQRNRSRYETVSKATGVPWQVVGAIHNLECDQSFRQHLHNGDPLTAQTRHVPAHHPRPWLPPYDWETSATDALTLDGLNREDWASIGVTLANVEAYNGTGYRRYHPDVPSPYLWSWTSAYSRGKYVEDGRWSSTAISNQCGVAPILRVLGYP